MIEAKIVADSASERGIRITTFLLTYPRFIHSELMTHRVFSRNAASSRAIPISKMIKAVVDNPAMPVEWGTNQKGMQAHDQLEGAQKEGAIQTWKDAGAQAAEYARRLEKLGVHKQIANRVIEPWMHMTTLVTATEWGNFFRLRAHPDAQPEFRELAFLMLRLYADNNPREVRVGGWHLPYDLPDDFVLNLTDRIKVAVARCARTSYVAFDGTSSVESDIALHDRLLESRHMSPFEHCATPHVNPIWSSNFYGWGSYRGSVEGIGAHKPLTPEETEDLLAQHRTL